MLELLIHFVLFIFLVIFSFYLPGAVVLKLLKIKLEKHLLVFLSFAVGTSLFLLCSYTFAWLKIPYMTLGILLMSFVLALFNKDILRNLLLTVTDKWSVIIVLLGTFFFVSTTFLSGIQTESGFQLLGVNGIDSVVHLAHIKNQMVFFPPMHPGLAGVEFRGYHYFYDFLISRFAIFYRFSVDDLFFRFFPVYVSLLYGCGFYFISTFLTKSSKVKRIILFLAFFGQNFSFLLLLNHSDYFLIQRAQLIQPIGLMFDPSVIFSIGLLLFGIGLLPKIKESWKYAVFVGLLLGILAQTKIYSGIIGIATLIAYSVYLFIRYRNKYVRQFLVALFITGFVTVVTYFPNNYGVGHLTYAPLLIYRQYMQQTVFANWNWEIKRTIYLENGNLLRIIQLYGEAIITFFVLNFGIRLVLFFNSKNLLRKDFWKNDFSFIFFVALLVPILIPSFFIQSLSAFDIQQFLWIELSLLSIATGIVLGKLIVKKIFLLTVIVIFTISMIQNWNFIYPYFVGANKNIIAENDISLYNEVPKIVPEKSFVVSLLPEVSIIPIVSYLSGRSVYYEKEVIHYPHEELYAEREKYLQELRKAIEKCNEQKIKQLMDKIGSSYLVSSYRNDCLIQSNMTIRHISGATVDFFEFR